MAETRIAVVTGAGKGIGRSIALALANEGYDIAGCSRTTSDLTSLATEIHGLGRRTMLRTADVSNERDVQGFFELVRSEFGAVHVLVNNAGLGYFAPVSSLGLKEFDEMWAINVRGVFLASQAVLPMMVNQHEGDIINISSLAGRNAFVGGAGYSATKWALIGFARTLMLEVREHNIRVITICPGSVETTFGGKQSGVPKSKGAIPTARDIATVVVDALRMPRHVMVSEIDVRPTNPKP